MAEIILSRLTIDNFKGCRHFDLEPGRKGCTISGENAAGKTTIFDAYMWLLWGKDSRGRKDFDIKPLLPDGTVADHAAITSVEGEFWADGQPVTLKRTYYERWSTKRGRSEATFDGHSSDYYLDDVPTQKNAFDAAVAQLVGDEETFRILTSVTYFPEQMKWQDRRAKLSELAGVLSDPEIMATDERFRSLIEDMGSKTVDDYKKMISAQRKTLARAKTDIPARIDEQQTTIRSYEGVDFSGVEAEITGLAAREEDLRRQLLELNSEDAAKGFKDQRDKVDAERRALEAENRSHRMLLQSALDGRIYAQKGLLDEEEAIGQQKKDLKRLTEEEAAFKDKIDSLRAEWRMADAREYDGSDVCPVCGQKLPEKKIRQAKAAFDAQKAEELRNIEQRASQVGVDLERTQTRICDLQDGIAAREAAVKTRRAELDAQPEPAPVEDLPDYAAKMAAFLAETDRLDKLIRQAGAPARQTEEKLRADLSAVQSRRRTQEALLAQRAVLDGARARVDELREQAKKTSSELEKLDGQLLLLEDFSRYKAGFVEDTINGMFEHARFRLFRDQINGGLEECCDVVYGGVPYSSLNNGARINIGIDILRTFGEKTGTTVPLFVDNAEAVTDLWTTGGQMILLKVDGKKKELTVK